MWRYPLFACLISSASYAGTISSGGGKIARYEELPWFFKNTTEVRYCIVHNPVTFHQSYEVISQKIAENFALWKKIMAEVPANDYHSDYGVGAQNFTEELCNDHTDIRFQMGTLTPQQRGYFSDVTEWVGRTVRENLDKEQLRSRGFIFIGADAGDDKMTFVSDWVIDSAPWSMGNGFALQVVLFHEIGHLFGMPHSMTQGLWTMGEKIPSFVISENFANLMAKGMLDVDRLFNEQKIGDFKENYSYVEDLQEGWHSNHAQVYGAPRNASLIRIELAFDKTTIPPHWSVKVYAGLDNGSSVMVGEFKEHEYGGSHTYQVHGTFPKEQQVFAGETEYNIFPYMYEYHKLGAYKRLNDGAIFPATINFRDGHISINVAVDGYMKQFGGFSSCEECDIFLPEN